MSVGDVETVEFLLDQKVPVDTRDREKVFFNERTWYNVFTEYRCQLKILITIDRPLYLNFERFYECKKKKVKVWFYIAQYPVRWTAQSALHFPPLADLFIPTPFSASLGSIIAMQQLRNDYSLTFPPLSIAR